MIPTARVFPITHFIFKGSLVDPRVRALNEHRDRPRYPAPLFSILKKRPALVWNTEAAIRTR